MNPTSPAPAPSEPLARLRRELGELYGAEGARALADITALLERPPAGAPLRPGARRSWTERDAVLITYGDQVHRDGEAPLRTLHRFLNERLAGLVSAVHVLPPFPSSSDDGFAVVDHTAIDPALGTWDDISRIARDFELMLDVVLNHVSASNPWLRGFLDGDPACADFFVEVPPDADLSPVVRPRARPLVTSFSSTTGERRLWTTFSPDQVDLNYGNPAVLARMVDVALAYVARGAALLRLDAVGYSWKEPGTRSLNLEGAHRLVRVLRAVTDAAAPSVALVSETNVRERENVAYFGDGTDEAQAVYQFPLPPLVLHAFLTGDAGRLASWISRLEPPPPGCVFLNFLASHDGIGLMPAEGLLDDAEVDSLVERVVGHGGLVSMRDSPGRPRPYELNSTLFDALSDPDGDEPEALRMARFMAAQSVMSMLSGVPAIYVHSLFGSANDRAAADASGTPRRINRTRFDDHAIEALLAEPASRARALLDAHGVMLRARASHPAFSPDAPQRVLESPPGTLAIERGSTATGTVTCIVNVTRDTRAPAVPAEGTDLLTKKRLTREDVLRLRPYEVVWLAGDEGRP